MLKLVITITAMLLSVFTFAQTQNKINISADIRGHACGGGFGLCSTSTISEKLNATISAQKISDTTILFVIDKASLSIENQKSIAGKELYKIAPTERLDFVQETNIDFEDLILVKLGFDSKYKTIKPGSYPMIIERDKILVTFTLSEKL